MERPEDVETCEYKRGTGKWGERIRRRIDVSVALYEARTGRTLASTLTD
jgi:hypothetical protein